MSHMTAHGIPLLLLFEISFAIDQYFFKNSQYFDILSLSLF